MAMCDSSWFKKRTPLKVFGFTLQWRAASKEVPWSSKGVQQLVFYLLAETSMWSLRLQKVPGFWELPSFSSSGRSWNLNWEADLLGFSLPAPASKSAEFVQWPCVIAVDLKRGLPWKCLDLICSEEQPAKKFHEVPKVFSNWSFSCWLRPLCEVYGCKRYLDSGNFRVSPPVADHGI